MNLNPIETDEARLAIVAAYRVLLAFEESGVTGQVAEHLHRSDLAEGITHAITEMRASMSPNLLVTLLPSHTNIRFATDRNREGETQTGIVRDGAWGIYPDRPDSTTRRITTNGWEMFVDRDTVFTHFEVLP